MRDTFASYSGEAVIPKRPGQEDPNVPPPGQTLSSWTYGSGLSEADPGTAWDSHRSMLLANVNRRHHQSPRVSGKDTRIVLPVNDPETAPCFRRLGSLAPTRGRNVAPPVLSLPGPSVTARCRSALAAYLFVRKVRARISGQARTRPGRIRTSFS